MGVRGVCEADPLSVATAVESGSRSTPLHLVAYLNHAGMAQDLVTALFMDANGSGSSRSNNAGKILVNARDARGLTPLHRAVRHNNIVSSGSGGIFMPCFQC